MLKEQYNPTTTSRWHVNADFVPNLTKNLPLKTMVLVFPLVTICLSTLSIFLGFRNARLVTFTTACWLSQLESVEKRLLLLSLAKLLNCPFKLNCLTFGGFEGNLLSPSSKNTEGLASGNWGIDSRAERNM